MIDCSVIPALTKSPLTLEQSKWIILAGFPLAGVMLAQVWVNHSHFLSALLDCGGRDLSRVKAAQMMREGRGRGAAFVLPELRASITQYHCWDPEELPQAPVLQKGKVYPRSCPVGRQGPSQG
jgi:hypothetical protein